jgi:hypothetical protein
MTTWMALTASAVLLAVVALATVLVLLVRQRRSRIDTPLRLYEMMRLRGVPPLQLRDRASAHDVAAAERRCLACSSKQPCDELLRTGRTRGYRQFCPNALYLEWLHSNSLNFD